MFSPDMRGTPYDPVGSGSINDIRDHEANMLPEPGHSPSIEHSTQMAGDVLPGPTGGLGETADAAAYAVGSKQNPKVKSIGMDKLKGWYERKK